MLFDKLQKSLYDKMSADRTLGQREMQSLSRGREEANDVWLQKEREKREQGEKREAKGAKMVELGEMEKFKI